MSSTSNAPSEAGVIIAFPRIPSLPVSPPTTSTRTRLAASTVDDLLPRLAMEPTIRLDLNDYAAVERGAAAMLSCALAGSLGDRPLEVVAARDVHLDWLDASGLAFALAHRPGPTQINSEVGSEWGRDWSPGFGSPWSSMEYAPTPEALFPPDAIGETAVRPDLSGPGFAAFVNPHLSRRRRGRHPVSTVLWPWLTSLIGASRAPHAEARARLVPDIGRVVDEVVANVGDHATADGPISSLVQVSITRGGGERSVNRLHIAVTDTGPGIAATARPRLPAADAALLDDELVLALLDGRLGPWGRARGQGLPRVTALCRRHNARLRVATRETRVALDHGELSAESPGFGLRGTVVTVSIPLAV